MRPKGVHQAQLMNAELIVVASTDDRRVGVDPVYHELILRFVIAGSTLERRPLEARLMGSDRRLAALARY